MTTNDGTYDLLGIGFGPSNLALAISLAEAADAGQEPLSHMFLERQAGFVWHGDMLLPGSDMQISFLKDLVSLRDPTNPYTFTNYLHRHGRLARFANRKTFFPSRSEFNDYLKWVAGHFHDVCAYDQTVVDIDPVVERGAVTRLRVTSEASDGTQRVREARNLVSACGGDPAIPEGFKTSMHDPRVIHSSDYLGAIQRLARDSGPPARVAVIGGGQSAAEIFMDLAERFPNSRSDLIFRGHALKPSDDSPFVNEIFDPDFTETLYNRPANAKAQFQSTFRDTNYGVVDLDLIERIYNLLYEQEVAGIEGHGVHPLQNVVDSTVHDSGIGLTARHVIDGRTTETYYDAVVLGTGYRRSDLDGLLANLRDWVVDTTVDRHYRLRTTADFHPTIFCQGGNEASHGLSDTLLSVLPARSMEIVEALRADERARNDRQAETPAPRLNAAANA